MGGLCVGGMDGGGISAHLAKKKWVTPEVDVRGHDPSFREERRTGPSSVPSASKPWEKRLPRLMPSYLMRQTTGTRGNCWD